MIASEIFFRIQNRTRTLTSSAIVVACVALVLVMNSVSLQAGLCGKLEIKPAKVQASSELEFRYTPGDLFKKTGAKLYVFAYVFTESTVYPEAISIALEKGSSTYSANLKSVPADASYIMFKVGDGRLFDWNNDQMWDVLVHNSSKPVRGAYLRSALSYLGPIVPSLKRISNLDKAKHELRLEVQNYPDNVQAKIGLASVLMETSEIDKAEFSKRVEELYLSGYDKSNENEVRAMTRALRAIGRPADAEDIENAYIKDHPKSDLAEETLRMRCYKASTQKDFESMVNDYITKLGPTVFSERMYIDLINSYLQQGNGDEAVRIIRSYPLPPGVNSNPPASILNMFAVSLLKQDSLIKMARQYAELAIRSAEAHSNGSRPRFMAQEEFDYSNREIEGISHDTYGFILRQLKQPAESVEEFRKACELLGDGATAENLEHYSEALHTANKMPESIEVMRKAIRSARSLPQMEQRFLAVASPYMEANKQELKDLHEEARQARLNNLRMSQMNYDIQGANFTSNTGAKARINDFALTTMDGKRVKLADLKGKVVVMDFWATWCGPCRASMPYMQKVYEKYRDNPEVQVVMVNVWERTADTTEAQKVQARTKIVNSFLSQNPTYTFPMMIDGTDAVVSCFGVTGIPTKFFIDKNGLVQFKEVGFPGADVFVEEASEKIEVLLNP